MKIIEFSYSYINQLPTWLVAILGSIWQFVEGNYQNSVFILVCLMGIDVLSGLLKGAKKRRLKSAIMSLGLIKKAGSLLAIIMAYFMDLLLNDSMPVFTTMMTWIAIGNEGLSIAENLTALGVRIPSQITDKLATFVDKGKDLTKEKDYDKENDK